MRLELKRKSIHLVTNSLVPIVYYFFGIPKVVMAILLGIAAVAIVIVDSNRTRNNFLSKIFGKYFDGMMRSHELDGKLTGASYVLIGSFLTITLFPKEIAILALLFAAVGDTFAALYGKKLGKIKIWNKTIEGSVVGFISCVLVALLFPSIPVLTKYGGAFAAMFIELLPIKIDDNLRIPLFSGLVMYILSFL